MEVHIISTTSTSFLENHSPRQCTTYNTTQHIAVITARLLALIALVGCEKVAYLRFRSYIHMWHALIPYKVCD